LLLFYFFFDLRFFFPISKVCGVANLLPRAHKLWLEALPPGRLRQVIDLVATKHDNSGSSNGSDPLALPHLLCPPRVATQAGNPSLFGWLKLRFSVGWGHSSSSRSSSRSSRSGSEINENGRSVWISKTVLLSFVGLAVLSVVGARIFGIWPPELSQVRRRSSE